MRPSRCLHACVRACVRVRVRVRVHVRRRVLCVSVLLAGRQPASCRTSTRLPPRLVARLG